MQKKDFFCRVISIYEDGPGFASGIRYGDFIFSYNSKRVETPQDFAALTESVSPDEMVDVYVIRAGVKFLAKCPGGWLDFSIGQPKEIQYFEEAVADDFQGVDLPVDMADGFLTGLSAHKNLLEQQRFDSIQLATLPMIDGYRIEKVLGVVGAECVYGMNFIKDIFANVRDFVGGRSKFNQDALREARVANLDSLKTQAYQMNANAVIGISFSFGDLSSGNQHGQMLMVCATGTAVVLAPVSPE